jgi:hypothetical protein
MADEDYFINNFNTSLSKKDEAKFNKWLSEAYNKYGTELSKDLFTYDLRGYWKTADYKDKVEFMQRKAHAPDTFKKPSHPTFSNESKYHEEDGKWKGGIWSEDGSEFHVSPEMLKNTHKLDGWFGDFMRNTKYNEGVKFILPESYRSKR